MSPFPPIFSLILYLQIYKYVTLESCKTLDNEDGDYLDNRKCQRTPLKTCEDYLNTIIIIKTNRFHSKDSFFDAKSDDESHLME